MPSPKYNPSCIKRTPEPTLPNPPRALLHLTSFRSFFGLFTPSLPYNTTVLNTPFTYSAVFSFSTPIFTTPNYHIYQAIACLNRQKRYKE